MKSSGVIARVRWMAVAVASPSPRVTPGRRMPNSSPPMRAVTALLPTAEFRHSATTCSATSPAWCPKGVVDLLELVEVDDGECERFTGEAGAFDGAAEFVVEVAAVVEAGEFVADGHFVEFAGPGGVGVALEAAGDPGEAERDAERGCVDDEESRVPCAGVAGPRCEVYDEADGPRAQPQQPSHEHRPSYRGLCLSAYDLLRWHPRYRLEPLCPACGRRCLRVSAIFHVKIGDG